MKDIKNKVDTKTAEDMIDQWIDAWGLDTEDDFEDEDKEELQLYKSRKKKAVSLAKKGLLVFDGENLAYHLIEKANNITEVTLSKQTADFLTFSDKFGNQESGATMLAMVSRVTGYNRAILNNFGLRDVKNIAEVSLLFLV